MGFTLLALLDHWVEEVLRRGVKWEKSEREELLAWLFSASVLVKLSEEN